MSAVGLYGPIQMLIGAVSTMLVGGSVILCGKYMGQNEQMKMQNVFSLDMAASALVAVVFIVLLVVAGTFNLTGIFTQDPDVKQQDLWKHRGNPLEKEWEDAFCHSECEGSEGRD